MKEAGASILSPSYVSMLQHLEILSRTTNERVAAQFEARSGKLKQRWAIDPLDGKPLRLVAGCIPILSDSRIILISSTSGKGWLVPKGGWEQDEELEEGAIRECFEEAGVLGMLGPKLDSFRSETRKARKKRLEGKEDRTGTLDTQYGSSSNVDLPITSACELNSFLPASHLIKPDEANSVDKDPTAEPPHTHVCMTFFPLYVQAIHDSWPEDSRMRQAFSIDGTLSFSQYWCYCSSWTSTYCFLPVTGSYLTLDAIDIIRPEFRSLLVKVKSIGLHLVGEEIVQAMDTNSTT